MLSSSCTMHEIVGFLSLMELKQQLIFLSPHSPPDIQLAGTEKQVASTAFIVAITKQRTQVLQQNKYS